jgi:hypothetical protein
MKRVVIRAQIEQRHQLLDSDLGYRTEVAAHQLGAALAIGCGSTGGD